MEVPAVTRVACWAAIVVLVFAPVVLLAAPVEVAVVVLNHHQGATTGLVAYHHGSRHKSLTSPLPNTLLSGSQCRRCRSFEKGVAALAPSFEQLVEAPHGVGIFDNSLPSGTGPDANPVLRKRFQKVEQITLQNRLSFY
jgi:hypothetical protein